METGVVTEALLESAISVIKPHTVQGRLFADVGAAVRSEQGRIFTGVCVDTPSWGLCAERAALAAMVTSGETRCTHIVAVWREPAAGSFHILPPCGVCREFIKCLDASNLEAEVVLGTERTMRLRELLPEHAWPTPAMSQVELRKHTGGTATAQRQQGRGRLIVVAGLPGSGKTTLAKELAVQHSAVRLCPDEWMHSLGMPLHDEAQRDRVEKLQWQFAQRLLDAGATVIVEWGTWGRWERDSLREGARVLGAAVELRYLSAPSEELFRRIRERNVESPPIEWEAVQRWAALMEPPDEAEFALFDPPLPL